MAGGCRAGRRGLAPVRTRPFDLWRQARIGARSMSPHQRRRMPTESLTRRDRAAAVGTLKHVDVVPTGRHDSVDVADGARLNVAVVTFNSERHVAALSGNLAAALAGLDASIYV